jgi:phosphonate transport system substrate-binding protein
MDSVQFRRRRKSRFRLLTILSLACIFTAPCTTVAQAASQDQSYKLGVFPFLPPARLSELFAPIAQDLGRALGKAVTFRTKKTMGSFASAAENQRYDIIYTHSVHYIRAHDIHGYRPVAKRGNREEALLVVRNDGPVRRLEDLRSRTVGMIGGGPTLDPVHLLITVSLREHGLLVDRDYAARPFKNPYECMHAVLIAEVDACSTVPVSLRRLSSDVLAKYRTIFETPAIPSSIFAVRPGISEPERLTLLNTILGWQDSSEGRNILKRLQVPRFSQATDADYDIVRQLLEKVEAQ